MTTSALATHIAPTETRSEQFVQAPPPTLWREIRASPRALVGGGLLFLLAFTCIATLPWTLHSQASGAELYTLPFHGMEHKWPMLHVDNKLSLAGWFGFDKIGRSVLVRTLLGGCISLAIGLAAAAISVVLGVSIGMIAGFRGGLVDSALMRTVDILYGLPYILLVVLFKIGFEEPLSSGVNCAPWRSPHAGSAYFGGTSRLRGGPFHQRRLAGYIAADRPRLDRFGGGHVLFAAASSPHRLLHTQSASRQHGRAIPCHRIGQLAQHGPGRSWTGAFAARPTVHRSLPGIGAQAASYFPPAISCQT